MLEICLENFKYGQKDTLNKENNIIDSFNKFFENLKKELEND